MNTAVGNDSLLSCATGIENAALGHNALYFNTASKNTAMGAYAGNSTTSGGNNTFVGASAGRANTTATANVAVGTSALLLTTTGTRNTSIGTESMYLNTTGSDNVAVGRDALKSNTTGGANIAIGKDANYSNSTASHNLAIGYRTRVNGTTGSENVCVGNEAGEDMTTGNKHTLIGMYAGQQITTNSSSVCVGYKAGKNTGGNSELFIARSDTANNQSSTWIYGDSSGTCYQGNNSTTWTTSSDERIKKDIVDSSNGLAKIDAIQVRNFNYRTQEEITASGLTSCDASGLQTGVIAQELETVLPNAVTASDLGQKRVNTDPIFWSMVKAIQELSAKVKALEEA